MGRLNWAFYHHMRHMSQYKQWFAGQGKILELLLKNKSLSQNKLLEILGIKAPSLSELLAKLEKQKLIKRTTDPNDSRGNIISLTAKGKMYAKSSRKMSVHHSSQMFASLSEYEKEQLAHILDKLHKNRHSDMHVHFHGHHFHHSKDREFD
jgi:DNA-binding MarR family transcriptional regulator